MENQLEKRTENGMETRMTLVFVFKAPWTTMTTY